MDAQQLRSMKLTTKILLWGGFRHQMHIFLFANVFGDIRCSSILSIETILFFVLIKSRKKNEKKKDLL